MQVALNGEKVRVRREGIMSRAHQANFLLSMNT